MGLDERTREDLNQWLRKARVYLWSFVAGGALAFAYTYYPLHGAKDRKIDHLEDRLLQESIRLTEFEEQFETMRDRIESRPDRVTFDELQEELAGAMNRQREFDRKLERADRAVRDMEKSRGSWKAKYVKLEKSRDDLAHALIVANASLKATEERAADSPPSPPANSADDGVGLDRGPNLASAGAGPGNGDFWQADSGPRPRSSNPAPEGTRAGAN